MGSVRRLRWTLFVAALAAVTSLANAQAGARPDVVFQAKKRSITAPAVAGSTVAWIAGPASRPGECTRGRKRLQLLGANGRVRTLSHRRGRNYETGCLYRPVLEGRFVLWSTPGREFIWARTRGQLRGWRACCGQDIEHHHDITRTGDLTWATIRANRFWPRWIGADGQERPIWVEVDPRTRERILTGSGLSVDLPGGFIGLDAAGNSVVARVKDGDAYSLIRVDLESGGLTTLVTSGSPISLPAVAREHAAYLVREGRSERIVLIEVATGLSTVVAERTGRALWGKGEIAGGRPLDYDGRRIVWAAGRRVLAVDAERPAPETAATVASAAKLAYESLGALFVASADGASRSRLGEIDVELDGPNLDWSPDGSRLVFGRDGDLHVVDADGSGEERITNARGRDGSPRWLPDGSRIVFQRTRGGDSQLWSVSPDGSAAQNLTPSIEDSYLPTVSPAGTRIAFMAGEGRPLQTRLYVMNTDGTGKVRLEDDGPQRGDFLSGFMQRLTWSSDGLQVAYRTGGDKIVAVAADGSAGQTVLVDTTRASSEPAFASDGRLAFISARNGNPELYLANGDGSVQTRLTTSPGDEGAPAWSPDGGFLAYRVRHLARSSEIYVAPADGSGVPVRLTAPAGNVGSPVWQPSP